MVIGIAPLFVSTPILLTVILFKTFIENWHIFIQLWGVGFMFGCLLIKFVIFERFYK